MSVSATTEYRKRRKLNLIKVSGSQCNLCGYHKSPNALEFHHIDASQKSYGIASKGTCHDLESDLAEIKKCILVCANCHREIHDGDYTADELWKLQQYSEEIANEVRQEKINNTSKTQYYCLECGKLITNNKTSLCLECARKQSRVCDRPSREELKDLIKKYPFTTIAKNYGVSDNAIRKWCIGYNLPSKKRDIVKYSDSQWLNI